MTSVIAQPTARWRLRDPYAHLNGIPRFPPIVATVLAARGITTRAQADIFYKPHLRTDYDPLELPDMRKAIDRVQAALRDNDTIALYGDFDVDGVTSIAVLELGLRPLGAKTIHYIPDRFSEGYGLNSKAISSLRDKGAGLLISADCGITSVAEVDHANARGLDVIILDHHTVPDLLPRAVAAVNPKRGDSPYPFDELAAVGVAYRFLQVLYEAMGRTLDEPDLLDLVALGTVVDVAPLTDENRTIVTRGLEIMQGGLRPGLEALATVSGTHAERFAAETLGFAIGPRMNAAGRLKHANIALQLMLAPDLATARPLAEELDLLNRRRQQETEEAYTIAEELCGADDDPLVMVGCGEIPAGIVGLVAARPADRRNRPAIVYEVGPETSRASARSIPGFDITAAIRKEQDLLLRHGGHRAAAGFSFDNRHTDEIRRRLVATAAEQLHGEALRKVVSIDAEANLGDLTGLEIKGLTRFEPCGQGNRRPVLLSRNVTLMDSRPVGADQSHLKLGFKDRGVYWPAIAFRQADTPTAGKMDIVYSLSREWRGDRVELEILDMAPSIQSRPLEKGPA